MVKNLVPSLDIPHCVHCWRGLNPIDVYLNMFTGPVFMKSVRVRVYEPRTRACNVMTWIAPKPLKQEHAVDAYNCLWQICTRSLLTFILHCLDIPFVFRCGVGWNHVASAVMVTRIEKASSFIFHTHCLIRRMFVRAVIYKEFEKPIISILK